MIKTLDRKHSDSKKWHKYAGTDIIPLWIADSDFEIAEPINQALEARIAHPVYGYPYHEKAFLAAVIQHCEEAYDWTIEKEWIVPIPGCVPGLNFARATGILNGKHSGLLLTPNYPPFVHASAMLDFIHQKVPLELVDKHWEVNFKALAAAITDDTGLLMLCHPHNPVGRVFDEQELQQFADIAKCHDLIVCSDEIHCDLVLNNTQHKPFASLNEDTLQRTITLMAPSKTFNIAGLCCAFAIIANAKLRQQFQSAAAGLCDVNVLGRVASTAAYSQSQAWYQEEIHYLQENADMLYERVNALPKVHMTKVEATYLAFIDARELGLDNPQKFFETKGLGFADGADYGMPGFLRCNFACAHEVLNEALTRFEKAVNEVVSG